MHSRISRYWKLLDFLSPSRDCLKICTHSADYCFWNKYFQVLALDPNSGLYYRSKCAVKFSDVYNVESNQFQFRAKEEQCTEISTICEVLIINMWFPPRNNTLIFLFQNLPQFNNSWHILLMLLSWRFPCLIILLGENHTILGVRL